MPPNMLTPSTPSSGGGLTPQHIKTPNSRILEPSPEETTDLEELEQFAKTFKQRRIKLGKSRLGNRLMPVLAGGGANHVYFPDIIPIIALF